jgi:endonuclease III
VIESLIGTILSQNTSARNSTAAKRSLDDAFGRNNFAAIVDAPLSDVIESIRHGGLANKKAAVIQNLLKEIHTRHGKYSLQYLAEPQFSNDQVMEELGMSHLERYQPKTSYILPSIV